MAKRNVLKGIVARLFGGDSDRQIKKETDAKRIDSAETASVENDVQLLFSPLFRIMISAGDYDVSQLCDTVRSVLSQTYVYYELIIIGKRAVGTLERFFPDAAFVFADSPMFASKRADKREHRFVGCLLPGDILSPNALSLLAKRICDEPSCDFVFADETVISGNNSVPFPKPDLGKETLLSINSVGRPFFVSHSVFMSAAPDDLSTEEAVYAFTLKCAEFASHPIHLCEALLTRRGIPYGRLSYKCRGIIDAYLKRRTNDAYALPGRYEGSFAVRRSLKNKPIVTVIILDSSVPNADALRKCLEGSDDKVLYGNIEIVITARAPADPRTAKYYSLLEYNKAASVLRVESQKNAPFALNRAAEYATGEMLLFTSAYSIISSPDSLDAMLEQACCDGVGAAGGKILDFSGRIYNAGTVVGLDGWAKSVYEGSMDTINNEMQNYFVNTIRNVTAVSSEFMMIKRDVFLSSRGFDESFTDVGYDTDLCLRLMRRGLRNVYTPYAMLKTGAPRPDYAKAAEDNISRCYDSFRQSLVLGDKYFNGRFDYAFTIPTLADSPYPAIRLNPKKLG